PDTALPHLRRAAELADNAARDSHVTVDWQSQVHIGIGNALLMKAKPLAAGAARTSLINDSIAEYKRALAIDPNAPHAKPNPALAAQMLGPVRATPTVDDFLNAGTALSQQNQFEQAIAMFRRAVILAPTSPEVHIYLGLGLLQGNHLADGRSELVEA